MGFLELIPADSLSAVYDIERHILTLTAKGNQRDFTSGISFRRQLIPGGLRFELEGWVGPLNGKTSPYTLNQEFSIQLPSPAFPSGFVTIVDSNHPKGVLVKIRFVLKGSPVPETGTAVVTVPTTTPETTPTPPKDDTDDAIQRIVPGDQKINVLFKEAFEIKETAAVPDHVRVVIKFDPKFVVIQDAGIQDKNIVWTLNSLQTGHTQVVVSIEGGIGQFHITKFYDIFIFLPLLSPPTPDKPTGAGA